MNPTLIYWITVAAIGFVAALGSARVGWSYYQGLRRSHPEQALTYWPEVARDQFLVDSLACNIMTGILVTMGIIRSGIGIVAVRGGASSLSLFALLNFELRTVRRAGP